MARKKLSRALKFVRHDMWRIRARRLTRGRSILLKLLRVLALSARGFSEDRGYLQASALTFYTLLSLVPMLAMAFGIAKGFGMDQMLEEYIRQAFEGHSEVSARIIEFSRSLLENTRTGLVAGIGVVVLLYTVMRMLARIEASINGIWGIRKNRPLVRRIPDYIAVLVVGPVLLILGSSLTVVITVRLHGLVEGLPLLGQAATLLVMLFRSLPLLVMVCLFTFLYLFMPNTKVKVGSALAGGLTAGILYQVVQWSYITFQVGMAQYNAIYGSFAALPLFLIWLQLSWVVALLGAEVSFAWQNVETFEFDPDCLQASRRFKRLTALRVTARAVQAFQEEAPPPTAQDFVAMLELPVRLVNEILEELVGAGVLEETVIEGARDLGHRPARPLQKMTLQSVLEALDRRGTDTIPLPLTADLKALRAALDLFDAEAAASGANILLTDIPKDSPDSGRHQAAPPAPARPDAAPPDPGAHVSEETGQGCQGKNGTRDPEVR